MNCRRGVCKYLNENTKCCTVDDIKCDMSKLPRLNGTCEYHCRNENNKELRELNPDVTYIHDADPLLPFWSCNNICKYRFSCDEE